MNKILKLLFTTALITVSIGCQTQRVATKSDVNKVASEVNYKQALKALNDQKFIIKIEEFYDSSNETPLQYPTDSYISMQGDKATLRLSPELFYNNTVQYTVEDNTTKISKAKQLKNGDMEYRMKIFGDANWKKKNIIITLYKDSNNCFVMIKNQQHIHISNTIHVNFRGKILPLVN